jgi:hypothetical protein
MEFGVRRAAIASALIVALWPIVLPTLWTEECAGGVNQIEYSANKVRGAGGCTHRAALHCRGLELWRRSFRRYGS